MVFHGAFCCSLQGPGAVCSLSAERLSCNTQSGDPEGRGGGRGDSEEGGRVSGRAQR